MQCLGLLCFAMCGVCCPVGLNALPRDISVQKGNICYIGMLIISHPSVTLRFVKMLSISNFQHTKMFGIKKVFFFYCGIKNVGCICSGTGVSWLGFFPCCAKQSRPPRPLLLPLSTFLFCKYWASHISVSLVTLFFFWSAYVCTWVIAEERTITGS
jgi:hypothetical protein